MKRENGAFAFFGQLQRFQIPWPVLTNDSAFIDEAAFHMEGVFMDNSTAKSPDRPQRILVISNRQEKMAAAMLENVCFALRDARLCFDQVDIADCRGGLDMHCYSCVLICAERLEQLDQDAFADLTSYVENGGGLVVARRAWHAEMADLFGFETAQNRPKTLKSSDASGGFHFISDTLPSFQGICQDEEDIAGHAPLDIRPGDQTHVFATNQLGFPVGWLNRHGTGRVIYWNSALLGRKRCRGLIVQSIAAARQVSVLPIANVALLQIDDFPAPLMHADMAPVADAYPGLSSAEFYTNVWHPDMMDMAERLGVTFTYFATFTYNDKVAPPFPFDEWTWPKVTVDGTEQDACILSARIAGRHGEIGLHGYNHMSLDGDIWSSPEAIGAALCAVTARWCDDTQTALPTCYVPPNNEYDAQGLTALSRVFPTVKVICGSYLAMRPEKGGQREFGEEPWQPGLFCLPRATSGYECSADMKFDALSQLGTSGIWTHFVHADDVFDHPPEGEHDPYCRNPQRRPWRTDARKRGLLDEFEAWICEFRARFPWLRFVSTSEAHRLIKAYLQRKISAVVGPDGVTIETEPDSYVQVRVNDGREMDERRIRGATVVGVDRAGESVIYTLAARSSTIVAPFKQEGRKGGLFDFARRLGKGIIRPVAAA